jgi:hypothetical protein
MRPPRYSLASNVCPSGIAAFEGEGSSDDDGGGGGENAGD